MELSDVLLLLTLHVLIEGHTLSDQVVESKVKDNFDKLACQGFALDDLLDSGSGHAHLSLEFLELFLQFLNVIAVLFLMKDVIFVVLENVKQ